MMNGRSLPVGQVLPSDIGRRRSYHQHQHQHQHQHLNQQYPQQSMYPQSTYVQNYGAGYYPMVPQYHNTQPQYPLFARHPPIPAYVAPLLPHQQISYSRPHHSPVVPSSYRPLPPSSPNPPSSQPSKKNLNHRSQNTSAVTALKLPTLSIEVSPPSKPFKVPLPWYSDPDSVWPTRKSKKKRKPVLEKTVADVKLPIITKETNTEKPLTNIPTESSPEILTTQPEIPPKRQQSPKNSLTNSSFSQAWTTPKLWAGIFKPANAPSTKTTGNIDHVSDNSNTEIKTIKPLAVALKYFNVNSSEYKVKFLEPRGLVNTGNMCYMNSIIQVLVFCSPFFNFLDQMGKDAVSSLKNETPLLDAMILVMREYSVIDSATSIQQLRMRLKEAEYGQFGEPFTPDFFYNVINQLPRFSSMRRGHQQDAEEFLGFLLEGLHDECIQVMQNTSEHSSLTSSGANINTSLSSQKLELANQSPSSADHGWFEVGPKQKTVETRSSGIISIGSPITKIFGGNLRSELRVPGLKDSVTLEPYQPLQLDIGAPNVHSILDALKGLTRPESLHGDFKSPRGPNFIATKQVYIETLPPVLILHLKRFQYDNTGGTQKIWKKIGYPLELELPKEIFPRQKRADFNKNGPPKYQLISVVYHHGKNASGGHYTVDVRRQDGQEWIRIDDTLIRRVGSDEVAGLGSEEDLKTPSSAFHSNSESPVRGRGSSSVGFSDKDFEGDGWKQANGSGKKWSSIVNGSSAPKVKSEKSSTKDNKIAYILFYQKL